MSKSYVIDYETGVNYTILVAEDYKSEERKEFVVHRLRNDIEGLVEFLQECEKDKGYHIGFNNISFDSQITEFILRNKEVIENGDPEYIAHEIYLKAQEIIDKQSENRFIENNFPEYSEKDLKIPCIDVFKLNHWENQSKR